MITLEKLKEFEHYKGYYDGFYMQKVKRAINLNSDDDWNLIDNLIQDIYLIKKNIASKEYEARIMNTLIKVSDSEETVHYFLNLANGPYAQ